MSKRKAVAGAIIGFLVAGAIAFGAFTIRANINGQGRVVAAPSIQFVAAGTEVLPTTNLALGTCTITVDAGGVATVVMQDVLQGESCDFQLMVDRNGGGASVVRAQNVNFSDVTDDAFINNSCGAVLDEAINTAVHVRFAVPAAAPLGDFTATLDPGSDLMAVNGAQFNPATCPSV